jgi:Putative transposase, YhgA-like
MRTLERMPHVVLVERFFTRPEVAGVLLRHALSPALVASIDWDTLRVVPDAADDPSLEPGDVLYSVELADTHRTVLIPLVLAQPPDPARLPLRLLQLACRLWSRPALESPEPLDALPLVAPLVLYLGPGRSTAPRRLSDLFATSPELAVVFPSPIELTYALDDLTAPVTNDPLARYPTVVLVDAVRTLLRLAANPHELTDAHLDPLALQLDLVASAWSRDDLQALVRYACAAFTPGSPLHAMLEQPAHPELRAMAATIRDEHFAEGEAKGRAEGFCEGEARGRLQGMTAMLLHLLDRLALSVPFALQERVAQCEDEAELRRWCDRAITATRIEDVFSEG